MAQFDIYKNPGTRTSKHAPYLIEVQGKFVDALATCVVVPLVGKEYFTGAKILNPLIAVNGVEYVLSPAEITSVLRTVLGKPVGSAQAYRSDIVAAIDRLLL